MLNTLDASHTQSKDPSITPNSMPLSFEIYDIYTQYCRKSLQKASEYSFLGAYIWKDFFGLRYYIEGDLLFLKTKDPCVYWAPLGDWNTINWDSYTLFKTDLTVHFVPEALALLWKEHFQDRVHLTIDRDSWDYLYSSSDLAELAGRKYAKKKNHLNNFLKTTPNYETHAIEASVIPSIIKAYKTSIESQDTLTPVLQAEYNSICHLLQLWQENILPQSIQGIYITIDSNIVAFAIGEPLSDSEFVIQIEKALLDKRGLYQCINKIFALQIQAQGYSIINRADDSGIAGLRKAKESYYPIDYIKKYTVQFRQ